MMAGGFIRKLDDLGRVVIPMELRKSMKLDPHHPIEIIPNGNDIIMRPQRFQCVACENRDEERHVVHRGIRLCPVCLKAFEREVAKRD